MQVETVGEFGREITIPCNLHGVPRPNVTWFRNGKPLSETPNIRFSVGSKGDSNTSEKQINAQGQKRKTTSTTDLKINFLRLEDSGMFQCSASNAAGDLVGYTWLRVKSKYIQIIESYRYYLIYLQIKITITPNNICHTFLILASSPIMIKPPQNLTALDGKDATISCNAQGAPAPNITWFFNGKFPVI